MPLINIVIALIVVGVALWLINTYIPMAGSIKTILNIVVVVSVAIWVLQAVGARFASALGRNATHGALAFRLDSALRQEPRYFRLRTPVCGAEPPTRSGGPF